MKTVDITPTPDGYRHCLKLIAESSTSKKDRAWARAELKKMEGVTAFSKPAAGFRLKLTDYCNNVSFIERYPNGTVSYATAGLVPLALSNAFHNNAAEAAHGLKTCATAKEALALANRLVVGSYRVEVAR